MDKFRNFHKICTKVVCVGRNYGAHAKELGNAIPTKPVLFLKPPSAIIAKGTAIRAPPGCVNLQHEVELGVVIGKTATRIPRQSAMEYIAGYCVALDMTARDLQNEAKTAGLPWCVSKGFDTSCPVSLFVPSTAITDVQRLTLELRVNDVVRQQGNTSDMLFPIDELVAFISRYFTLQPGDLILTGTPEGVSKVDDGDRLQAVLRQRETTVADVTFSVGPAQSQ